MTRRRTLIALIVCLAIPVLAGCAARHISQAQDHFSKATAIEKGLTSRKRDNIDSLTVVEADQVNALTEYRLARGLLLREIEDNEADLRQDQLLGTAKTLLAMSMWRISALTDDRQLEGEAQKLANAIVRDPAIALGTRDKVVLLAFPGFGDHQKGLAENDPNAAATYFRSAVTVLEKALSGVPQDHDVRAYIRLSQMQSLKAWFEKKKRDAAEITKIFKRLSCALQPLWSVNASIRNDLKTRATNLGYTWNDSHYSGCPAANPY